MKRGGERVKLRIREMGAIESGIKSKKGKFGK